MNTRFENRNGRGREGGIKIDSVAMRDQERMRQRLEDKIERDLEDSFPASDPPGWTLGVDRG